MHERVGVPRAASEWTATTPPRSWAELAETLHGGLAILDGEWRLTYASERFLHTLADPGDLIGHDFLRLIPALAEDEPRGLRRQLEDGKKIEFEQHFLDANEEPRWFRVTVLPLLDATDEIAAAVFAKDISPTSRRLAQLRNATQALTEIEVALRRRLSREVHDGPVQLLAALMIRLGLVDDGEMTGDLEHLVAEVTVQMRAAIAAFAHEEQPLSAEAKLRQWIDPCLADSQIDLEIDDRRHSPWELSELQNVFVFLYQTVRAAHHVGGRRRVAVIASDENDGIQVLVTVSSSSHEALEIGRVQAQYRAVQHHARALGGTMSNSNDGMGTRSLRMWIPAGAQPTTGVPPNRIGRVELGPHPADRNGHSAPPAEFPRLDDAAWLAVARAAPERLVEHDDAGNFTFVNDVQHEMLGRTSAELMGERMGAIFSERTMDDLLPTFARLLVGEVVDVQWRRDTAFGESQLVRVTSSPRLDDKGQLLGTLSAVDDLSDVHFLEDLYHSALSDLGRSRRFFTERTLRQLRPTISACAALVQRLEAFAERLPDGAAFHALSHELERATDDVRRSVGSLEISDLPMADLGRSLAASLQSVMAGTELHFTNRSTKSPSQENGAALFSIAREAVINASTHGGASNVTMELRDEDDGLALEIHDDGIGIAPEALRRGPAHLGTHSMRERARERGGHCHIGPGPEGGTLVRVWVPHRHERFSLLDLSRFTS